MAAYRKAMRKRVIVMALDSVGEDHINDFLSRGYMPHVQSLIITTEFHSQF